MAKLKMKECEALKKAKEEMEKGSEVEKIMVQLEAVVKARGMIDGLSSLSDVINDIWEKGEDIEIVYHVPQLIKAVKILIAHLDESLGEIIEQVNIEIDSIPEMSI
ncbi:MAG: hypothetical protein FWC68_03570 [Oscillospiraceae bacterium]|nr:hypothetical protein [Oscillospiraceae bacterium]